MSLAALASFAALAAYVLTEVQFEKPRVVYVATGSPVTVDVHGSAPEPKRAKPARVSDLPSVPAVSPQAGQAQEIPTPPPEDR